MQMKKYLLSAAIVLMGCMQLNAQVALKGIGHNNRYDDGDQMKSKSVGWNATLQKSIFVVDNSIYSMNWDGSTLSTPVKNPAVNISEFYSNGQFTDNAKALWANNFNMMYANSGAVYVNGKLVTVFSRDEQSTPDEELFRVCKWDAKTGDLLSTEIRPKSDRLESAGMSYNPKDGKVYGLFYLTGQDLGSDITSDPDYFEDEDADMTDGDAGYAICTIDLKTMKITPITKGLYYYNFITFAINSEGRAFALTSGGTSGAVVTDGRITDINGNYTGAQLYEFDLQTGLMKTTGIPMTDPETGENYTEYVSTIPNGTGYASQYKRQAACFAKSNPGKMYWIGYVNSGKGINDWGSWGSLSDKEWRTNGKYDTALYEVDILTGIATRLSTVTNRWTFSALWADGDDCSDDATIDPLNPGNSNPTDGCYIALQHADNGSIWQRAEMGQQYTYYIEANDGWQIHSVTFNGTALTVGDGNTVTTPAVSAQYSRLIVILEQATNNIETPAVNPSQVKILGSAEGIHIAGARPGDRVAIYGMDGRMVHAEQLNSNQADIALKPNALYIIKVADKVVKVRL